MSVYNGGQYLGQAVESVLAQTFTDFEFIVINDGSTDNTAEILRALDDSRLRIINNARNVGLSRSLIIGIQAAQGEFIARQDADDTSDPERLSRQVEYLDRHPDVGVVGTSACWIGEGDKVVKSWPPGASNGELQQELLRTCPLIHGSTMFRRICYDEVDGYNTVMRTGQDYDFWLRISETWDLVCLPEALYTYRQHSHMASVQHRVEQQQHAGAALAQAIARRKRYARLALRIKDHRLPPRLVAMGRRRLAQRFAWWSAGSRELSWKLALRFLLAALLLDPTAHELWAYVGGILLRKARLSGMVRLDRGT
jgi:glycosyltransferase involved in cell wall biosynthesis